MNPLDKFIENYIAALCWSEADGEGESFGGCNELDFGSEALDEITSDCKSFLEIAGALVPETFQAQAACDFALTRNGHGAGFWGGGWPKEDSQKLTEISQSLGSQNIERGDNGKLYVHG